MLLDPSNFAGGLSRLVAAFRHKGFCQDTNFDINGDGTIDMVMKYAWSAVANATSYEVEISRSTNLAGPYTVVGLGGITNSLEWRHICNVNYYYKARVRARNAYGQPGTWTALSTAVQPAAKSAGATTPTSVSIIGSYLGFTVQWAQISDLDYDRTEIGVGADAVTPPANDASVFTAIATRGSLAPVNFVFIPTPAGTHRYIYVRHVNTSGGKSSWIYAGDYLTSGIPPNYIADDAVPTKIAALAANDIGSYAFLKNTSASAMAAGSVNSAANLAFSSTNANTGGGTLSGTWQAMGSVPAGAASLFLRVS